MKKYDLCVFSFSRLERNIAALVFKKMIQKGMSVYNNHLWQRDCANLIGTMPNENERRCQSLELIRKRSSFLILLYPLQPKDTRWKTREFLFHRLARYNSALSIICCFKAAGKPMISGNNVSYLELPNADAHHPATPFLHASLICLRLIKLANADIQKKRRREENIAENQFFNSKSVATNRLLLASK